MTILAEIADNVPSTPMIVLACFVAAALAAGVASAHRALAWGVLILALGIGGALAVDGYRETRAGAPFAEAIGHELGWPWVAANVAGPLLPAVAVIAAMVVRRWRERASQASVD